MDGVTYAGTDHGTHAEVTVGEWDVGMASTGQPV